MSDEHRTMLADSVGRLLRDASAVQSRVSEGWNAGLWSQVDEMGLPLLLVPEADGGIGGHWDDAHVVLHALGAHAVALPVGESMLARRLLALAAIDAPAGLVGLAPRSIGTLAVDTGHGDAARYTGSLDGVPWGRHLQFIVAVVARDDRAYVMLVPRAAAASMHEATNLAGEPRDRLRFESAEVHAVECDKTEGLHLLHLCALLRVGQIAGALETALARSIAYATERIQFGKPIGSFQAVQQQLAVFGSEVGAVGCASRAAFRATTIGDAGFEIAAAKLRANLAIDICTAIAHQVHGAIGFTHEYDLRHFTQRLWSWRSEFGNDRHWTAVLGSAVITRGADAFWTDLTQRGDAAAMPMETTP
jgi:acyl-CoA dehydrogenase